MGKAGVNSGKAGTGDEPADDVLLERFTAQRDQAAFAALVRRHGPLVLGVCRRVLHHEQDAEDAFQAVFCVLARKPGAIRRGTAVGGWLYAVASRIAWKAKALQVRRRMRESELPDVPAPDKPPEWVSRDLWPILDEEVNRLPERYRRPFVLCHLEGKTNEQAAAELRCAPGTVSSRLTRARQRLRARLTRRGMALSARMLAAALSRHTVAAAVRAELAETAVRAGVRYSAGRPVAARVAGLADGFLKPRALTRWAIAGAVAFAVAVLIAIVLLLAFLPQRAGPGGAPAPVAGPPVAPQVEQEKLQGNWQVVAVAKGGQAQPNAGMRLAFAADKMVLFGPGFQTPPMPCVFDPAQTPKTIDVNSPVGGVWRGIYELNGDSMKLCLNQGPAGGNRPTTFRTQPGAQGVYLYVLRRERAGAKGP
jgi:RNA polymerase sigma factor (sigma-70 family)